jgi:hypothetical protein
LDRQPAARSRDTSSTEQAVSVVGHSSGKFEKAFSFIFQFEMQSSAFQRPAVGTCSAGRQKSSVDVLNQRRIFFFIDVLGRCYTIGPFEYDGANDKELILIYRRRHKTQTLALT